MEMDYGGSALPDRELRQAGESLDNSRIDFVLKWLLWEPVDG